MAKGKSSASSATRKKHARKAAAVAGGGTHDEPPQHPKDKQAKTKEKGSKKSGKKEPPRKKVYVPPAKPVPARPDPLDTLGIAHIVPVELLVVLRRLAKKDTVTKRRALEDLHADWVEHAKLGVERETSQEEESEEQEPQWRLHAVLDALPVWIHHVPSLFLHPSRRIRSLAVAVHGALLKLPSPAPESLLASLHDAPDQEHTEYVLAAWCMASFDVDRQVATYARDSWTTFVAVAASEGTTHATKLTLGERSLSHLWSILVRRVLVDPSSMWAYVNPPPPPPPPPAAPRKGGARNTQSAIGKGASAEEDAAGTAKGDEEEENEDNRWARMRVGAFGAAEWVFDAYLKVVQHEAESVREGEEERGSTMVEDFLKPLDNPVLWSALYHAQEAPFVHDHTPAFGFNQPSVRRAAWMFLASIVRHSQGHLDALVPTLSAATLRSAWIEPDAGVRGAMWQALMLFLKAYPSAWQLASTLPNDNDNEDSEDSESNEDDEDEDDEPRRISKLPAAAGNAVGPSVAYQEFRQFLELGCMGSPTQGYPAILVVLSTIPASVLASVSQPVPTLFTSFWAALDGRALSGLDRGIASAAFLSAVLECSVFMARRMLAEGSNGEMLLGESSIDREDEDGTIVQVKRTAARGVVCEQLTRAWEELCARRLKVDERAAAGYFARTLAGVGQISEELADDVWNVLAALVRDQVSAAADKPLPALVAPFVDVFATSFPPGTRLHEANKVLTKEIVQSVLVQVEQALGEMEDAGDATSRLASFVPLLDTLGEALFVDPDVLARTDEIVFKHAYRLLLLCPQILQVYLRQRTDDERRAALWHTLLRAATEHPDRLASALSALLDLVTKDDTLERGDVLRPKADELDSVVSDLLMASLHGGDSEGGLWMLKRLLETPDPFISSECYSGVLSTICRTFSQYVYDCLRGDASAASADGLLGLLDVVAQESVLFAVPQELALTVLRDIFVYAYIVPSVDSPASVSARSSGIDALWERVLGEVSQDLRAGVLEQVKELLHDVILDCAIPIWPSALVAAATGDIPHVNQEMFDDVVLCQTELDAMLAELPGQPTSESLAVLDPLVLQGEWDDPDMSDAVFDQKGLSAYARIVFALLSHVSRHRDLARTNIWAVRHFYALRIHAQDLLDVPSSTSPVFGANVSRAVLEDLVQRVDQIAVYLLAEDHEPGWLAQLAVRLGQSKSTGTTVMHTTAVGIEGLLKVLASPGKGSDAMRNSRILRLVLQHLFSGASKQDAEQFLVFARSIEKTAPYASLAITFSVTQYAPEPPRLDRLRNELAANMLGIPPSKANTDGLWTLRKLAAVAPDPDSDVVFLPTPRAVNVMKACQAWITSDEDLEEEVDTQMACVFWHLAPILQNVPGSHWDLIYDVVENNLENCSFEEVSSLPLLRWTLELVIALEDLTSTNKVLRNGWDERRSAILTMVRDLIATKPKENNMSKPLSVCRSFALTVVQDLPQSLIGNDTLSKMCHLVTDASESVPQMAYKMLREAANKRTEYLVVEASIDSDDTIPLDLPAELVQILHNSFLDDDLEAGTHHHRIFGYLLSWMLVYDLFKNASLTVKSGYMDHLHRENLVPERFLPHIFSILRLYRGSSKAVKLDIWEVDEFYLELYSGETPIGLPLLAAHLYYRALLSVPSLIRNWLLGCRDRQLLKTVTKYTSTHFSPAIIRAELAQVKDPALAADLADDTFTVKVANAVREITAAFAVDEYSLELRLQLPQDFPLHNIVTKDSNRIGVTDDRWRAWILGVQQILTFRSGNIVDGLAFFKKNVTSHFEGRSECAICYSMISAMDGSLPKKPCKTCKNRFHAGCLYKWFNSSHSSSCPLCRSEIIQ